MLKNKLYPYLETYINEYLHGFSKEQFEVGLMTGTISLENLNFRPDKVNSKLDEINQPFWLKAGKISKITMQCSLMNFIGEKPIDLTIKDINIILTPSYKWLIKNKDSFIIENEKMLKEKYDPNDNNSVNIFSKKVNLFDNSFFHKENKLNEIYKDSSKLSERLNKFYQLLHKFYSLKNFLVNITLNNIHIRFEDDQLINMKENICIGMTMNYIKLSLWNEGDMKKTSFRFDKLNCYYENEPQILISSSFLLNSLNQFNELDKSYYTVLNRVNLEFKNNKHNTNCFISQVTFWGNLGINNLQSENIDLFRTTKDKKYEVFFKFNTSDNINININSALIDILTNYKNFCKKFVQIEYIQEFKPLKKPYNNKDPLINKIISTSNSEQLALFKHKKKMIVRDWLFYFFWCSKCKDILSGSLENKELNPFKLEFCRYYYLMFDPRSNLQQTEGNNNQMVQTSNTNNDNIILSFNGEIKFNSITLTLTTDKQLPSTNNDTNNKFSSISLIVNSGLIKLNLDNYNFTLNTNIGFLAITPISITKNGNTNIFPQSIIKHNYQIGNFNINSRQNSYFHSRNLSTFSNDNNINKNQNSRYWKKMKILTETLRKASPQKIINKTYSKNNKSKLMQFVYDKKINQTLNKVNIETPLSKRTDNQNENNFYSNCNNSFINGMFNSISNTISLKKQKKEQNISFAILEYNQSKSNKQKDSPSKNGNSISYEEEQLYLFSFTSINFKYTKYAEVSKNDECNLNINIIKTNIFDDYIKRLFDVIKWYEEKLNSINFDIKNKSKPLDHQKELFPKINMKYLWKMQKSILNKCITVTKQNSMIQEYIIYLQEETEKTKMLNNLNKVIHDSLLWKLLKGFNLNLNYNNCYFIKWKETNNVNENKVRTKASIAPINLEFKLNLPSLLLKCFDSEIDIDDINECEEFIELCTSLIKDRFKIPLMYIEPCLKTMKNNI